MVLGGQHVTTVSNVLGHANNVISRAHNPASNGHSHRLWQQCPNFHQYVHCLHPSHTKATWNSSSNALPRRNKSACYRHSITKVATATIALHAGTKGAKARPITKVDTCLHTQHWPPTNMQPSPNAYHGAFLRPWIFCWGHLWVCWRPPGWSCHWGMSFVMKRNQLVIGCIAFGGCHFCTLPVPLLPECYSCGKAC